VPGQQPRQPKGVPIGGQWRARSRPEGVVDLRGEVPEVGVLQVLGASSGPFHWTASPENWRAQGYDEPPGMAAAATLTDGVQLWAEIRRSGGWWEWSVERSSADAGLITVGSGRARTVNEAMGAVADLAERGEQRQMSRSGAATGL
jgi:hypothetical protein